MSILTVLHVFNIVVILALVLYLRHLQGSKPYSLFWSILFCVFRLSSTGMIWYMSHPKILVRQLLFTILFIIDIILMGQLIENSIFHRPIYMLFLSPIAWFLVLLSNYFEDKPQNKVS